MVAENNQVIKCKHISSQLPVYFGFKLLADGNIENADKVYCIHCDKSFAFLFITVFNWILIKISLICLENLTIEAFVI